MQKPVCIGNLTDVSGLPSALSQFGETHSFWTDLGLWMAKNIAFALLNVNHPIYDSMNHVNALGAEFSCKGLRHSAQSELPCCKAGELSTSFQGSGSRGEYKRRRIFWRRLSLC